MTLVALDGVPISYPPTAHQSRIDAIDSIITEYGDYLKDRTEHHLGCAHAGARLASNRRSFPVSRRRLEPGARVSSWAHAVAQ